MGKIDINLIFVIIGILITFWGTNHQNKSSDKEMEEEEHERIRKEATEQTELKVSLQSIDKKVTKIGTDIEDLKKSQDAFNRRLIVVEESTKSAHHRIDRIEGKKES